MPKRNAELLNKIADRIEAEPLRYSQGSWVGENRWLVEGGEEIEVACGTTFCVAGWAVIENGGKLVNRRTSWGGKYLGFADRNGHRLDEDEVPSYARRVLGLTEDEAGTLFEGSMVPLDINYNDPEYNTYDFQIRRAKAVADALRKIADGADVDDLVHA